jgi:hypothetical protein
MAGNPNLPIIPIAFVNFLIKNVGMVMLKTIESQA